MKYEITQEDKDVMQHDLAHDRTLKYLRNLSFYKFSIGDVLIREEKTYSYKTNETSWETKIAGCDLPYKYVYVFENELGVGYIRRLSVNGRKFVEKPICVTEFDPDQTRFSLDPEYADHMLLANEDEEFDAKSRYNELKKKREALHRKNKKVSLRFENEAAAREWVLTLKPGDQFWYGYGISSIRKEPYFLHNTVLKDIRPPSSFPHWQAPFNPHIEISSQPPGTPTTGQFYKNNLYLSSMVGMYFFTERPLFFDEMIN